jgi:hypothetical protein
VTIPFIDKWWEDEKATREMAVLTDTPNVGSESWEEWRHRIFEKIKQMRARNDEP